MVKNHFGADLYLVDVGGEEDLMCPFCPDEFDMVGLCCHIGEEHSVGAKNGNKVLSTAMLSQLSLSCLHNEGGIGHCWPYYNATRQLFQDAAKKKVTQKWI